MKPAAKKSLLRQARSRGFITHEALDALLDDVAKPRSFESAVRKLLGELKNVSVRTSASRAPAPAGDAANFEFLVRGLPKSDPLNAYVREIADMPRMEREDEVRLAKRLEFMRRRLQAAILAAGVPMQTARRMLEDSRIRPLLEGDRRRGGLGRFLPEGAASLPVIRACREYDDVRREFIERNLHLVVAAAAAYRTYGVPVLDLIQEGNGGLIRAVEKFDWRKSVRFRTYATFWIRQAVERSISANKGIVRVPNYLQQKMRRLRREGRLPRRNEDVSLVRVAREFEVSPEVANRLLQTDRATRSLDVAVGGDSEEAYVSTLAIDEEQAFLAEWEYPLLRTRVTEVLSALPDHERTILEYRYGIGRDDPMTLEEVGRLMNVSRERVRQLQVRALRKLQAPSLIAKLACFV